MLNKIKNTYYKDLFLYGFYGSYIVFVSLAALIDFLIGNYFDAFFDFLSVLITMGAFRYYLQTNDRELATVILFWISSAMIFLFILHNRFDISIIFTLLIPMTAFILLPGKKVIIHVGLYLFLLALIFIYGYNIYETHPLLYSIRHMSAYVIALFFVIAFGIFYHIAVKHYYSELERIDKQKTFLLKEIHHRVKNNLNLITSILGIQKLESESEEVHKLIDQNIMRLESIAMAHEMLYLQNDLANINFDNYVTKLTQYILKTHTKNHDIQLEIKMIPLKLAIENMIQFGILINELMTNSIKHAFGMDSGLIMLRLVKTENGFIFYYNDNGKGLDKRNLIKGFGIYLIEMTVLQLEAKMSMSNNHGLHYEIEFKG